MKKYTLGIGVAISAVIAIVACFFGISMASAQGDWNFTVPVADVRPQNGVFTFPAAAFEDGKSRFFEYKPSPSERIRFFVVKSTDGIIRAAFDACDVCFHAKKGYVQQGDFMVCINCGLKFRTDKVNEVHGGCNPSPLKRTMQGGNVVISQNDVTAGLKFFR